MARGKSQKPGWADLQKALERGDLPGVVMLMGDDGHARTRALQHVLAAACGTEPDDTADLQVTRMESPVAWEDVEGAVRTRGLFGGRPVVVVDQDARKVAESNDDLLAEMIDHAAAGSLPGVLVLCDEKFDGRRKATKAARKAGMLWDFPAPKDWEVPRRLQAMAQNLDVTLTPGAAERMADALGTDMRAQANALEKCAVHVEPGGTVDEEVVDALVARDRNRAVWDLTDALTAGDPAAALTVLDDLLQSGQSPYALVGVIAWSLRRLLRARLLLDVGLSPGEAAGRVGVRFRKDEFIGHARALEAAGWTACLRRTLEADLALKGRGDGAALAPEFLMERLVTDLCRSARPVRT